MPDGNESTTLLGRSFSVQTRKEGMPLPHAGLTMTVSMLRNATAPFRDSKLPDVPPVDGEECNSRCAKFDPCCTRPLQKWSMAFRVMHGLLFHWLCHNFEPQFGRRPSLATQVYALFFMNFEHPSDNDMSPFTSRTRFSAPLPVPSARRQNGRMSDRSKRDRMQMIAQRTDRSSQRY